MTWHVTLPDDSYEGAMEGFEWDLPDDYNAAHDLVGKHDEPDTVALYQEYPDGRRETYTFAEFDADVPYDGAGQINTQEYQIDRDEAVDLLEGSGLPPGM